MRPLSKAGTMRSQLRLVPPYEEVLKSCIECGDEFDANIRNDELFCTDYCETLHLDSQEEVSDETL